MDHHSYDYDRHAIFEDYGSNVQISTLKYTINGSPAQEALVNMRS